MNEIRQFAVKPLPCSLVSGQAQRLQTSAGTVDLWMFPFSPEAQQIAQLQTVLAPEEQTRAQGFRRLIDQQQFIFTRATLRNLLADYLSTSPALVRFDYGAYGKPYLLTPENTRSTWQFNVSHTHGFVAYAITTDFAVGLDVEWIAPSFISVATAEQFLTTPEINAWQQFPPSLQPTAFFHAWTCKEAYLKTLGTGFSVVPQTATVVFDQQARPQIINLPATTETWDFYYFMPRPEYVGALGLRAFNLR